MAYQNIITGGRPQTTLTNIIAGGNFPNTDAWGATSAILTADNNIISLTGDGTSRYPVISQITTTACVNGNKIYFDVMVRSTNSVCQAIYARLYGSGGGYVDVKVIATPTQNEWYQISETVTLSGVSGFIEPRIFPEYADAASASGKVIQLQSFVSSDLSAIFGTSLEPTTEQYKRWLSIFSAGWFNTTKAIPKRIY